MKLEIPREKLAYIAGFFDGEGCATFQSVGKSGLNKNGREKCYSVSCCISNNNIAPLLLIKELVGGKIYERKSKNINHSTNYILSFTNMRDIYKFLFSIKEFLILKKPSVEVILQYLEIRIKKINLPGKHSPITDEEFNMIRDVRVLNSKNNKRVSII